jgi:hypothetical protein
MRGLGSTVTWGPSDQHLRPYSAKGGTHDPLYRAKRGAAYLAQITAAILYICQAWENSVFKAL